MSFSKFFIVTFLLLIGNFANAYEMKETQFDGQKIWYSENSQNPIISIKIAFENAGTAHDPVNKMGLANFVTAMLNEGAGEIKSAEFLQLLEDNSIGFSANADADNFFITIKTLSSNLDLALKLLNLAITQPNFEQADFDRIKKQVLTSLKKKSESANKVARDEFKKTFFAGHPYSKLADGNAQIIEKMTPADLHGFVRKNFAKDNFRIAAAGDISERLVKKIAKKIIAGLPTKSGTKKLAKFTNFPVAQDIHVDKDFPQTVLFFAKKGVSRHDDKFYAAYLLNHIFGGGSFQSRLYKEVREKRGLTYYSWSSLQAYEEANLLVGSVATQAEKKQESIDVIREEIEKLAARGVTEEELESARKYVVGAYPFGLDSSRAIASHILDLQLDGLPIDYMKKREKLFNDVTIVEVNELTKDMFGDDGWVFLSVGK